MYGSSARYGRKTRKIEVERESAYFHAIREVPILGKVHADRLLLCCLSNPGQESCELEPSPSDPYTTWPVSFYGLGASSPRHRAACRVRYKPIRIGNDVSIDWVRGKTSHKNPAPLPILLAKRHLQSYILQDHLCYYFTRREISRNPEDDIES